jgi:hypothetical protein
VAGEIEQVLEEMVNVKVTYPDNQTQSTWVAKECEFFAPYMSRQRSRSATDNEVNDPYKRYNDVNGGDTDELGSPRNESVDDSKSEHSPRYN